MTCPEKKLREALEKALHEMIIVHNLDASDDAERLFRNPFTIDTGASQAIAREALALPPCAHPDEGMSEDEDKLIQAALEFADKALPYVNHPVRNSMDVANNRCVSLARAYRQSASEVRRLQYQLAAKSLEAAEYMEDGLKMQAQLAKANLDADAEMERVKACEHIAENEPGWEKLRNLCPSTAAVASMRDQLAAQSLELEKAKCCACGKLSIHGNCGECISDEVNRLCERAEEAIEYAANFEMAWFTEKGLREKVEAELKTMTEIRDTIHDKLNEKREVIGKLKDDLACLQARSEAQGEVVEAAKEVESAEFYRVGFPEGVNRRVNAHRALVIALAHFAALDAEEKKP